MHHPLVSSTQGIQSEKETGSRSSIPPRNILMHHCIIHHSKTLLLIIEHHRLLFENNVKETIVIDKHTTLQGDDEGYGNKRLNLPGPS
jgi:hypothetical protein